MTRLLRFVTGYVVGNAIVGAILSAQGDDLSAILDGLGFWIPVGIVYGTATVTILTRLRVVELGGIVELCGLCAGLCPTIGLFPPYMWIWPLAILLVGIHSACISLVALGVWITHRSLQNHRKRQLREG